MVEQGSEQVWEDFALCSFFPVFVVRLLPNMLHPCVHQHIAGAGIEAERRGVGREDADIGNAANVEYGAGFIRISKQCFVKGWDEGRTLTVAGKVAAAEVADRENAG